MDTFPKKIKIRGEYWTIKFVKRVDKKDNLGETDIEKHVIKIQKGLHNTEWVFMHELVHAALAGSGLTSLDEVLEETIANCVADVFTKHYVRISEDTKEREGINE